jgi:hypothetical protein
MEMFAYPVNMGFDHETGEFTGQTPLYPEVEGRGMTFELMLADLSEAISVRLEGGAEA